jgi:CBS domain-containing protein
MLHQMLSDASVERTTCLQIMGSRVAAVTPEQTVEDVARRMRDHSLGFLPVCDSAGTVIGVVTDRDLAVRVCAENREASTIRVNSVMSRDVVACRPTDPVSVVEALMTRHLKLRIVVTEANGQFVGIISLTDIARAVHPTRAASILLHVTAKGGGWGS